MDKNSQIEFFSTGKIPAVVLKNAIPAMVGMMMVLIYNLADTFFIGQTHVDLMVTAVAMCTPVFMMFLSVGLVFGLGGVSVISRAMGEGRTEYVKKVSSFCLWTSAGAGILLAVIYWIFMDRILKLMGVSEDAWEYAKAYMVIVTGGGPFVVISNCLSSIIRAEGRAKTSMNGMLIGNLANVILDPLMILVFGWQIKGAAIATVIGNILAVMYYLFYFRKGNSLLSIHPKNYTLTDGVCKNVLIIGIPASLSSLLMSISQIVLNGRMAAYDDMAMAGIGVAAKVTMITGMICVGLGQGVQPILGFLVGAKNWERFRKVLRFALLFALGLSLTMTVICYLFTPQIVNAVLTKPEALEYGIRFARILLSTNFLFGVFFVLSNTLQAMGAATPSLIVNISRQGLLFIPIMFFMEWIFGMNGLVWAQPVVDVLSTIMAATFYILIYRNMSQECSNPSSYNTINNTGT